MARGNNKMPIFLDDLDRARFLEMLEAIVSTYEIDLWLFCLMENHYHLVFRTRRPNLSLAVGCLNGRYARWWNKRHHRVGHMFQGRFKAQIVEASVYLVRLCRYVLLNPVRAGLCSHPAQWPWSSYRMLAGTTSSGGVDVESLLRQVDGEDPEIARARLLDFVEPDADPEIGAFIRSDRRVIGTHAYAARFRAIARAAPKEVPARDRRVGTPGLVEILADAVRRGEGLPGGVRLAHAASYSVSDIAECAGLARGTVQRMVDGRSGGRRMPGTPPRSNADLAPGQPGQPGGGGGVSA
jgi:putative transposase